MTMTDLPSGITEFDDFVPMIEFNVLYTQRIFIN